MASYLRPRRGKEATAKSQNIVLKRGEVFFETPSGGVGTGIGKIKMGDGSTSYASLPYFLRQLDLNDNNTKLTDELVESRANNAKLTDELNAYKNNKSTQYITLKSSQVLMDEQLKKATSGKELRTVFDNFSNWSN